MRVGKVLVESHERPRVSRAVLLQQESAWSARSVGRRAMDGAKVVHGDRACWPGQSHRLSDIDIRSVHGTAKHTVGVVVEDRSLVAARDHHHWAVFVVDLVDHDSDRGQVVIGVGGEGPVLVPFDWCTVASRFQVELRDVETNGRSQELLEYGQDVGMTDHSGIGRMVQMSGTLMRRTRGSAAEWLSSRS